MKKAKNKAFFYLQNIKIYVNILKQKRVIKMDFYSEKIFNMIGELEEEIENFKIKESNQEKIENLNQIINAKTLEELEKINDNSLEEEIKIKKIAVKLNNYEFEQYKNLEIKLNEMLKVLTEQEEKRKKQEKELEEKIKQQTLLEYVYNLKLPIEDENIIENIINKYKENNVDPKQILRILINENINYYTNEPKKEKILTKDKMDELNLDESDQDTINKVKEIISKSKNIIEDKNMTEYLESLDEENLIETLEELSEYNKTSIIGTMKYLLKKINDNIDLEQSLELLNTIYNISTDDEEEKEESEEKTKLIFISKPTNLDLYIYEDINKIEHKVYLKILKKQFEKLINGDIIGKSLTGLPENLFEKKASQVRITYKVLPNNYILVLNCYTKGNKYTENIRELIEKPNISFQIHLYDVLASQNQEQLKQLLSKTTNISEQEKNNYINNFTESQNVNILDQFEEGEKIARKNKTTN